MVRNYFYSLQHFKPHVDGGKNPLQQRDTLPIPQVPIRLTNVWQGKLDGIMDPLPSKVWLIGFKAKEHKNGS